jgi:hypothetical protein
MTRRWSSTGRRLSTTGRRRMRTRARLPPTGSENGANPSLAFVRHPLDSSFASSHESGPAPRIRLYLLSSTNHLPSCRPRGCHLPVCATSSSTMLHTHRPVHPPPLNGSCLPLPRPNASASRTFLSLLAHPVLCAFCSSQLYTNFPLSILPHGFTAQFNPTTQSLPPAPCSLLSAPCSLLYASYA